MTTENKTQALSVAQSGTPGFLADATTSLANMEKYANLLIQSGLVPKHFYELDQYRNPVKPFRGNTAAVIMTIQHGLELGMSITQSLQQIVPVNGLMSLKGDAAKALIMRSGLCKEWTEDEIGTPNTDSFGIKITSKRTDGQTITRSFTVQDAKRAGLWIDDSAVAKEAKLAKSPWYRYQPRMLRYRALGFISRDLYGDVLQNMYTEDEARDIEVDNTIIVTQDGITAHLDESKPEKLNSDAKEALAAGSTAAKPQSKKSALKSEEPKKPEPKFEEAKIVDEKEPVKEEALEVEAPATEEGPQPHIYTKTELDGLGAKDVLDVVNGLLQINVDEKLFIGDNKSKRVVAWLKKIVLAYQEGTLNELLSKEFNVSLKSLYEQKERSPATNPSETVSEENPWFEISEPGEGGRPFGELLELEKKKKELQLTDDALLSFISDNELGFAGVEDFYHHAPSDTIKVAFGL